MVEIPRAKLLAAGGLLAGGILVAVLVVRAKSAPAAAGAAVDLPAAGSATYGPVVYNIAAPATSGVALSNPGSTVLFEFNAPPPIPATGSPTGAAVSGAGSPDGSVTGPCNCPGGGAQSYGTMGDLAAGLGPFMSSLLDNLPPGVAEGNYWGVYQPVYGGKTPLQTAVNMAKANGSMPNDVSLALVQSPQLLEALLSNG